MMSRHIGSSTGTDALQMLQAQQAFRNRPAKESAEAAQPDATAMPVDEALLSDGRQVERRSANNEAPATQSMDTGQQAMYREVQNLASDLGYVGLSERAIERAMIRGESLLADYRA